jgi:hypothetical protein
MKRALLVVALSACSVAFAQSDDKAGPVETPPPDVEKMPFSPESIRKVVAHHQPQIQTCYEEVLASLGKKVVEGRVMTWWIITAEGMVKNARVLKKGTTLREPKLHECVVTVITAMSFPKPPKGKETPIEYPFNLTAIK